MIPVQNHDPPPVIGKRYQVIDNAQSIYPLSVSDDFYVIRKEMCRDKECRYLNQCTLQRVTSATGQTLCGLNDGARRIWKEILEDI